MDTKKQATYNLNKDQQHLLNFALSEIRKDKSMTKKDIAKVNKMINFMGGATSEIFRFVSI
tara:strand:- start:319 stop:501 length:183 start_codon:yes stop_codon:yes gene_type:complete